MMTLAPAFIAYAGFGAVTRALFGVYRGYTTLFPFQLDYKRVMVEIAASIFFGTFGVLLLSGIEPLKFALDAIALVSGFLGADLLSLVTKKVGLKKELKIVVSDQQVNGNGLNEREINALEYLKSHGRITNKEYQTLNNVSKDVAKRELGALVMKKRLQMKGRSKATCYMLA